MDILTKLAGYRTYLTAVAYGVDQLGSQLGWWPEAALRTVAEEVLAFIFLRAGMK